MNDSGRSIHPAPEKRNIILIGYRGCGKTSVGRELAVRLGWTLVDTDDQIQANAQRSISDIFEQLGEQAFRQLESQQIAQVAAGTQQVISVGGGGVLDFRNRDTLRCAGVCVWLTASAEELHRRLQADPQTAVARPPLTGHDGLAEIRHLLDQRAPLYADLAHHIVETGGRSINQVADEILALLAKGSGPPEAR